MTKRYIPKEVYWVLWLVTLTLAVTVGYGWLVYKPRQLSGQQLLVNQQQHRDALLKLKLDLITLKQTYNPDLFNQTLTHTHSNLSQDQTLQALPPTLAAELDSILATTTSQCQHVSFLINYQRLDPGDPTLLDNVEAINLRLATLSTQLASVSSTINDPHWQDTTKTTAIVVNNWLQLPNQNQFESVKLSNLDAQLHTQSLANLNWCRQLLSSPQYVWIIDQLSQLISKKS